MLKLHEGTGPMKGDRHMPYNDTEGYTTIGYGRNIEQIGISRDEARSMLVTDLIDAQYKCANEFGWYKELNEPRQGVVTMMVFNLGLAGFKKFKKTIKHLSYGDYGLAADEMLRSRWADQVGDRAKLLSAMMQTGEW